MNPRDVDAILAKIRREREARTDEEKAAEHEEDERRMAEAIKNYPPAYQRSLYADRREFEAGSGRDH